MNLSSRCFGVHFPPFLELCPSFWTPKGRWLSFNRAIACYVAIYFVSLLRWSARLLSFPLSTFLSRAKRYSPACVSTRALGESFGQGRAVNRGARFLFFPQKPPTTLEVLSMAKDIFSILADSLSDAGVCFRLIVFSMEILLFLLNFSFLFSRESPPH